MNESGLGETIGGLGVISRSGCKWVADGLVIEELDGLGIEKPRGWFDLELVVLRSGDDDVGLVGLRCTGLGSGGLGSVGMN